jgi:hypothetical protein
VDKRTTRRFLKSRLWSQSACGTKDFSAMSNEIGDASDKERNPGQSRIGFSDPDPIRATCRDC